MMLANGRTNHIKRGGPQKRVAYLMSRFPKISETFILYEMIELERLGLQIELFPFIREKEAVMHGEAGEWVERAHFPQLNLKALFAAQLYWLRRRPRAYVQSWWEALRGNSESRKFLARALMVVPIAAFFARRMERLGVTHVHAHWASHPTLAAYVVHKLAGLPYSFTAHAHDIYVERAMLGEKLHDASFVVTISEYNRRFLRERYGDLANHVHLIHCGVDPDIFRPPVANSVSRPWTLISVARLQEMKGHPYLIEACRRLKAAGISFRCLLVGEGEDRSKIEAQIASSGLSEEVRLLGHQPRDQVCRLVASADVVVMPSITAENGKKEGIPVAMMEALATERPVVATAISGIPELVEDGRTGLLVPERDGAALAEALLRLYREPELARSLGKHGREKVLQEFDLRRNAARLYDLFVQCPDQHAAPSDQAAVTGAMRMER